MEPEIRSNIKQIILDTYAFDKDTFSDNCTFFAQSLTENYSWFPALTSQRQTALIALCFLLGIKNVMNLHNFMGLMRVKSYLIASEEIKSLGYMDIAHLIFDTKIYALS